MWLTHCARRFLHTFFIPYLIHYLRQFCEQLLLTQTLRDEETEGKAKEITTSIPHG